MPSGNPYRQYTCDELNALIQRHTVEVSSPSMPARPKLSVLIVTYNHVPFIAEALEGALRQQVDFPYEIVVGEDRSTDGTTEIVLDYQKRYPDKIRVLLASENFGQYTGNGRFNFIRTLRACRGEYVAFLEGDDYWTDPQKLQLQVEYLDQNSGCAICHHKVNYINWPAGKVIREFPALRFRTPRLDPTDLAMINCIQTCSAVVRRKWIPPLDEEFQVLKLADWPLFVLLSQKGWIGYLDRNMAHYRVHANNVWNNRHAEFKIQALGVMAAYLLERVDTKSKDLWEDTVLAIAFKNMVLAARSFSAGQFGKRLAFFIRHCVKFKKPFWVLNRLWPYYKAHNLAG